MSTSSDKPGDSPTPPPKSTDASTVILLLGIAGDTTWRMFVPVIGGTVLGIWGDHSFGTKPWATVVGVAVAALLIRQQFKKDVSK
jgi:hypothetical protein